jgi:HK97 family phage major capsid protein
VLVDLIYALRAGYRQNATFVMNRKTQSTVRKFKDSTGNYLWQPPAVPGGRSNLIGFALADTEDMPRRRRQLALDRGRTGIGKSELDVCGP